MWGGNGSRSDLSAASADREPAAATAGGHRRSGAARGAGSAGFGVTRAVGSGDLKACRWTPGCARERWATAVNAVQAPDGMLPWVGPVPKPDRRLHAPTFNASS
jgi:hypothetical protein